MEEALNALLPTKARTGDLTADLAEAAKVSMQRRVDNSRWGGVVIAALHQQVHSWSRVASLTGIPIRTARRWASPPPGTETATE